MIKKSMISYGFAIVAICLTLSLPSSTKAQEAVQDKIDTYELLNLFGDVLERIRSDYVEAPSDKELIEAAIMGMLSSLDPHSSYMNAENFNDMKVQTRGEFGGLGIEVTMESGFVKVVTPIDDTPAYRAGLKSGDFITHLDGEGILGLTLNEAVDRMRGKVDTDITLTVRRGEQDAFDVTITRAVIKIQSVRSRLEGNIGYLRITHFNEQADKGLLKALSEFTLDKGDELRGIVLDLRNNPGGLLNQAVAVSDAFLDKGEIVSTRSRRSEDTERFNARPGDFTNGLPMVVLINGGSASASEIVAGALKDHGRAIILGTRSFGKGSVQTIIPLLKHGAMRLTTARYYTPSGTSIQATGIEPDIFVEQSRIESLETFNSRREEDLRGALQNENSIETKDEKDPSRDHIEIDKTIDEVPQDYQLNRALDLLRGIALFSDITGSAGE